MAILSMFGYACLTVLTTLTGPRHFIILGVAVEGTVCAGDDAKTPGAQRVKTCGAYLEAATEVDVRA